MEYGQQCKERQHEPLSACDAANLQNSDSRDGASQEAVRAKAYRIVEQLWWQAETTGISAFKIEREMLRLFGATEMTAIKAWNFDEVIRYLTEYGDQLDRSGASRR